MHAKKRKKVAFTKTKKPKNKSLKPESSKATLVYKHDNVSLLFMQNLRFLALFCVNSA